MSELELYKGIIKKMKNDDIEEKKTKRIIEKIEGLATYVTIPRELAIYNVNIDSLEAKLLIDYITNLQQENEELNKENEKWWAIIKDNEQEIKDLCLENSKLEQENEKLKQDYIVLRKLDSKVQDKATLYNIELENINKKRYEDYKSRIEKAVEYINNCPEYLWVNVNTKELLNILNGRSDE